MALSSCVSVPRTRGRAPEFFGGRTSESGFLNAAEDYLGAGYREVSPGRYVSADGMRQVRFGAHETRRLTLHGHFEAFDSLTCPHEWNQLASQGLAIWLHLGVADCHELSRIARVLARWPELEEGVKREIEAYLQ